MLRREKNLHENCQPWKVFIRRESIPFRCSIKYTIGWKVGSGMVECSVLKPTPITGLFVQPLNGRNWTLCTFSKLVFTIGYWVHRMWAFKPVYFVMYFDFHWCTIKLGKFWLMWKVYMQAYTYTYMCLSILYTLAGLDFKLDRSLQAWCNGFVQESERREVLALSKHPHPFLFVSIQCGCTCSWNHGLKCSYCMTWRPSHQKKALHYYCDVMASVHKCVFSIWVWAHRTLYL